MNITQIRNATVVIEVRDHVILVDPMLAPMGAIPALKYLGRGRRRNPTVELPENAPAILEKVTDCLITHCQKGHFDHLDRAAAKWLRERQVPVHCMAADAQYLSNKGLKLSPLESTADQAFLGGRITPIPCVHGRGFIGRLMAHGHGYVLDFPDEPTLYIAGDTILTEHVERCLKEQQPEIVLIPAGGARFDVGGEIIMGVDDVLRICQMAPHQVVANHLEALDHCPVTRAELARHCQAQGFEQRLRIPLDGEMMRFEPR